MPALRTTSSWRARPPRPVWPGQPARSQEARLAERGRVPRDVGLAFPEERRELPHGELLFTREGEQAQPHGLAEEPVELPALARPILGARLRGHHAYFTIGENIGTPACRVPTGDIFWRTTRQPVVLDDWPVSARSSAHGFTTVASWRGSYGRIAHGGLLFGLKAHEFRKFVTLPTLADHPFEIALESDRVLRAMIQGLRAIAGSCIAWPIVDQNQGANYRLCGRPANWRRMQRVNLGRA